MVKKRFTIINPNGDEIRVLAKNKGEALDNYVKKVGKGKKSYARRNSDVECGWEMD